MPALARVVRVLAALETPGASFRRACARPGLCRHTPPVHGEAPGAQLQYQDGEKDVVAMYNVFSGVKDGRPRTLKTSLVIERDLKSGLYGMSLGVGFRRASSPR